MKRIELLQKFLDGWSVDSILIENPIDLFYLTGLQLSKGRLFVFPKESLLWVDGRYFSYATDMAPCPVQLWDEKISLPAGKIGFDSATTSVYDWENLRRIAPKSKWQPIVKPLKEMRALKDPSEIQALRKAADLTWRGIEHIKDCLQLGVSEKEIAWEFEQFVRTRGASALSFEPIVAFGKNSALPHHRASSDRLKKDQVVLFDVGAVVDHYRADATRVYFFGDPDPRMKKIYHLVRQAHLAARNKVFPEETIQQIDEAARNIFRKEGVENLFVHSLGHGIGLETHEYPLLRYNGADAQLKLQNNMVFTIEPGLYLHEIGGVRLEDTGLVGDKGFDSFYPELEEDPTIR